MADTIRTSGAPAPILAVLNGVPTTTSTYVAEYFGKQHIHVMRDIRNLIALDPECLSNFGYASRQVHQPNGGVVEYPEFRITEEGFMLLAMGFTGKKALGYKLAFIAEFKRLRAALAQRPQPAPATTPACPEIDVAALLLSGQIDPVPLTPEQYRLIDQRAYALSTDAHALIREHLLRAVACRSTWRDREDPANTGIAALLGSITLGQTLAHQHHAQVRAMDAALAAIRDLATKAYARLQADHAAVGQLVRAAR